MTMKWLACIGILCIGIAAQAITLALRTDVTVAGPRITLGEVADIDGTPGECEKLGGLVLGNAPIVGQTRRVSRELVLVRLRYHGYDPDAMTILCDEPVKVARETTTITGETLVTTAREWLRGQMPALPGEELELAAVHNPADVQAPSGDVSIICKAAGSGAGMLRSVMVEVIVNEESTWRGLLSFKVRRYADALVTRSLVRRGEAFDPRAIAVERRDVTGLTEMLLCDASEVEGMRAVSTLRPGAILTTGCIEEMPVIFRKETLRVTARCGALRISAIAIACEDGRVGDVIRVTNPDTRKEFNVRVTRAGEAEVILL